VLRRCACVALVFGCRLSGAANLVVNYVIESDNLILLIVVLEFYRVVALIAINNK
jgi:hypothetical protein